MRFFIFFVILSSLLNCNQNKKEGQQNLTFEKCECEKSIKTDSSFYATNIRVKNDTENKFLKLKCASIEIAIASVSDENGNNEHCENLYDIKCISNQNYNFKLANKFAYSSDEMKNMDITAENGQKLFFEDIKSTKNAYFEMKSNKKREIIAVSKLTIK